MQIGLKRMDDMSGAISCGHRWDGEAGDSELAGQIPGK